MNTVWKQRLSNYGCGALAGMTSLTVGGALLGVYDLLARHASRSWGDGLPAYVAAFVAIDLLYYVQHRAEHRVPWLWALHEVHHQSTLCDTSVSLRLSALTPVSVLGFQLVLAVAGAPTHVYLAMYALHGALIFLLHARTPRWFDRAGWVLNSPYLHRGHHSNHPRLRGKNLGGVFVVWDRLCGTYEARCDDATRYGVGQRATPLNPVAANVAPWLRWPA